MGGQRAGIYGGGETKIREEKNPCAHPWAEIQRARQSRGCPRGAGGAAQPPAAAQWRGLLSFLGLRSSILLATQQKYGSRLGLLLGKLPRPPVEEPRPGRKSAQQQRKHDKPSREVGGARGAPESWAKGQGRARHSGRRPSR